MADAPVLSEVEQWLQRGAELRKQLLAEREQVAARLAEIDATLRQMPSNGVPREKAPGQRTLSGVIVRPLGSNATAPDVVLAILEAHPDGLTAPEIVSKAQELRPKIDPRNVHSALQRTKGITKIGSARKYRYLLASAEGGAQ